LLRREFGNLNFVTVEKLMYYFIEKISEDEILNNGELGSNSLDDSIWNTSSSNTHFENSPSDCYVNLYKSSDKIVCFSINNTSDKIYRKVIFTFTDGSSQSLEYTFYSSGHWHINDVVDKPVKMEIFNSEELIFSKEIENIENYIE
jgi:hypothetical protein